MEKQENNQLRKNLPMRIGRADVGLYRREKVRENTEMKENVVSQNIRESSTEVGLPGVGE